MASGFGCWPFFVQLGTTHGDQNTKGPLYLFGAVVTEAGVGHIPQNASAGEVVDIIPSPLQNPIEALHWSAINAMGPLWTYLCLRTAGGKGKGMQKIRSDGIFSVPVETLSIRYTRPSAVSAAGGLVISILSVQ